MRAGGFIWTIWSLLLATIARGQVLTPSNSFLLRPFPEASDGVFIREMKAGADGLWFLVEARGRGDALVVKTDFSGRILTRSPVRSGARALALAATATGAAVLMGIKGGPLLVEYGPNGMPTIERKPGCTIAGGLFTLAGEPATLCSDGTITVHGSQNGSVHSSWGRNGALALDIGKGAVAFVDQSTAGILVQDLVSGAISTPAVLAPEIQEALARVRDTRKNAQIGPEHAAVPPGRPIIVMDATSMGPGIFLLIWPYHPQTGPGVLRLNGDGEVTARHRCLIKAGRPIHKIAVSERGELYLCSTGGEVFRFASFN